MNKVIQCRPVLDAPLAKTIAQYIGDRRYCFVFPSQIAADSWAQAVFKHPDVEALEPGRFLSWDRFLALVRERPRDDAARPADPYTRYLWACSVLKENAENPFLRVLVKPSLAPPARYPAWLASIASHLDFIAGLVRREIPSESHNAEISDFIALAEKYRNFLARNNLFEETSLSLQFPEQKKFMLFGAAAYTEFFRYREALEKSGCTEFFDEIPIEPNREQKLCRFENFRTEVRWVFANIRKMLNSGKSPSDFAISVPSLKPDMKAYLAAFSREYNVELSFRAGEKLSSSPFGILLSLISAAIDDDLSLESLEALARQTFFAWKQAELFKKLMDFARLFSIPRKSAGKKYMSRIWSMTFSDARFEEKEALFNFYLLLQKKLSAVAAASSFQSLREALFDFRLTFIDDSAIPEPSENLLARIFEELVSLERTAQSLKDTNLGENPFQLFRAFLDTVQYAPHSSDSAVSVYPYHSGLLNAAQVHFVLETSQDAVDAAQKYPSFPEQLKKLLPDDASYESHILRSFDCVNAIYCFADVSLAGFCVPHPWFSAEHMQTIFIDEEDMLSEHSLHACEKQAWIENTPERLHPLTIDQQCSALGIFDSRQVATSLPPPLFAQRKAESRLFITADNVSDCIAPALHGSSIKISPGALGDYAACPFRWFLAHVVGLQNRIPSEPLMIGSILHDSIRTIVLKISEEQPVLRKETVQRYADLISSTVQQSIDYQTRKSGHGTRPSLEANMKKMKSRLTTYLDLEAELQEAGWTVGEFEKSFEKHFEKLNLIFNGRTDRLMFRREGSDSACILIDYKKKNIPLKKNLMLDEKTGQLAELQIPGYILLLTEAGFSVVSAFYYSLENAKKQAVLGSESKAVAADVPGYCKEIEALRGMLEKASKEIWSGKIMDTSPFTLACSNCEYRPICRANYASERH
ncbi:MAG: PD-(D/E)XK nuclease family protein [Spirochaetia bacterium]|nr:PD-(D/E)XK nuclease family protein [Spirochaetia bacterium]